MRMRWGHRACYLVMWMALLYISTEASFSVDMQAPAQEHVLTFAPNCHLSLASLHYRTVVIWPQYPGWINKGNVESQITLLSFRMILCYIFPFLPGRKGLIDILIVLFLYLFKSNLFMPCMAERDSSFLYWCGPGRHRPQCFSIFNGVVLAVSVMSTLCVCWALC